MFFPQRFTTLTTTVLPPPPPPHQCIPMADVLSVNPYPVLSSLGMIGQSVGYCEINYYAMTPVSSRLMYITFLKQGRIYSFSALRKVGAMSRFCRSGAAEQQLVTAWSGGCYRSPQALSHALKIRTRTPHMMRT